MPITPKPPVDLQQVIEELARRVKNLESLSPRTYQSGNFDGNAATGDVGTLGWGLDGPTGNAVFNEIILRAGIIGDDALTNPLSPDTAAIGVDTFAIGSPSTPATVNIAVPVGFTRALVLGTADMSVFNSTGGVVNPQLACLTDPSPVGDQTATSVAAGQFGALSNTRTSVLTGLSGGSIAIQAEVATITGPAIPAHPFTTLNLQAFALFLR